LDLCAGGQLVGGEKIEEIKNKGRKNTNPLGGKNRERREGGINGTPRTTPRHSTTGRGL